MINPRFTVSDINVVETNMAGTFACVITSAIISSSCNWCCVVLRIVPVSLCPIRTAVDVVCEAQESLACFTNFFKIHKGVVGIEISIKKETNIYKENIQAITVINYKICMYVPSAIEV